MKFSTLFVGLAFFIVLVCVVSGYGTIFSGPSLEIYSENYDAMSTGTFPAGYIQYYSGRGWEYAVVTDNQSHSAPNSFKMEGAESWSQEVGIPLSEPLGECVGAELYVRTARAPGDGREGNFTNHEAGLASVAFLKPSPREGFGGVQFAYDPNTHEYNILAGNETYTARYPFAPDTWYKLKILTNLVDHTFSVWMNDTPFVQDLPYTGNSSPVILLLNCDNGGNYTMTWYDDVHIWYENAPPKPTPTANFTTNITYGQVPLPVLFTDTSTGLNITGHLWSFGDGATSNETSPVHVYQNRGTYTVSLQVSNASGNDTITKANLIRAFDATPLADFVATPEEGEPPLSVQFYDTSAGSPTTWLWDFGDGTTTTLQSPLHTYMTPGNYTVTLTAGNSGGTNTTIKSAFIRVLPEPPVAPVANFTADIGTGRFYAWVDFYDASTGTPDSWNWSFGDGSYSEEENPWHFYRGVGNYTVSLTVSNSAGTDTITRENFVVIPAPAPIAEFSASPRFGTFPLTVEFSDYSVGSVDWDIPPASYEWDFGDGTPNSTEKGTVYHTYRVAGNYTVTLTVSDVGGQDTMVKVNYIGETPPPAPVADFTAIPRYGFAPLTVNFIDQSTGSPELDYTWDFGDNTTSTEKNPTHTYGEPGHYTVTLTTANRGGTDSVTKSGYINVFQHPPDTVADFTAVPRSGTAPLTVSFIDQTTGPVTTRCWMFGDGGWSDEKNPVHVYTAPGVYNVTLLVMGTHGAAIESKTDYIVVTDIPALCADFTSNVTTGTVPLAVQFLDASTGNPGAWSWVFQKDSFYPILDTATKQAIPYFGNEFSAERNPVVTYTYPGNYSVSLTVSRTGETDTITKEDYIQALPPAPVVDFDAYPREGEAPLNVQFYEMVPYAWYYDEFLWDFGDGTNGTGHWWVEHTYPSPGLYNVTLTVNSAYGSNSTTKDAFVNVTLSPPTPQFEGSPVSGNAPLDVVFTDTSTGIVNTRLWDFGDGTTAWENATATISHTYLFPGTYTVSLTAGNSAGQVSLSKPGYILVNPSGMPPRALFFVSPMMGSAPLTVRFTDMSSGAPLKWSWDFGDGNTSSEKNPVHTYYSQGKYTPTLTVSNSGGSSSYKITVWVRPRFVVPTLTPFPTVTVSPTSTATTPAPTPVPGVAPVAFFKMNPSFGRAPLTVQFTDLSFNTPTSWQWDFGDGHTSTLRNPVNTFSDPGTYAVTLKVANRAGESTTSRPVYVV